MEPASFKPYPTIGQAFGIFGLYIVFASGIGLIVPVIFHLFDYENMPLINLLGYTIAGILTIWVAVMFKRKTAGPGPIVIFGDMPILLAILLLVLTPAIAIVIEPLSLLIPVPEFVEKLFALLLNKTIFTGIMVVVAAPLIEEVLFRGMILDGFLKRYSPWKAILWSSVIFGLFHLNPWQFIPAFILGVLMGYVYWKTRSLWLCIFIHFINNGLSYLALFFVDEQTTAVADLFSGRRDYLLSYFISVGIVVLGVLWLIRLTKTQNHQIISNGSED
ncbi:MAG: CPBP family intramembrane metalloprotease [Bacteroidales bacterium]|nr:CPBP family intramembrane metalloprotease [Bacteroidales bacterium]